MKYTISIILILTLFSCKQKHVSDNEIQRTVENTDLVLTPPMLTFDIPLLTNENLGLKFDCEVRFC